MAFEVFANRTARRSQDPTITLTTRGVLTFSKPAWHALNQPGAVHLLYDRDARIIGLRPAEPGTPDAYTVQNARSGKSFRIGVEAFLSYYDIPTPAAVRRQATMESGVLCIDLNDDGVDVTSNRRARF